MKQKHRNFTFFIEKDYDALSRRAAEIIGAKIKLKPNAVLGLATGSTPIGAYRELIAAFKAGELDFSSLTSFNLDEYYPISKANDQSYHYFMHDNLFNHVNMRREHIFVPDGEAVDARVECANFEQKIADAGGIELQLLGLGDNGHIAFNEPADSFAQATFHVELDKATIEANSRFFANVNDVPKHALTMGIGTIMQANEILMLISGEKKAEIAEKVLFGEITPRVPGSALQLHQNVTIILDEPAAKLLLAKL